MHVCIFNNSIKTWRIDDVMARIDVKNSALIWSDREMFFNQVLVVLEISAQINYKAKLVKVAEMCKYALTDYVQDFCLDIK